MNGIHPMIMNGIHPMIMNQLPYPMMATRSGAMIRREKLWHLFKQVISEYQLTGSLLDITLFSPLGKLQVSGNQLNGYLPEFGKQHLAVQILDLSNGRGSSPDTGFSSLSSGSLPDLSGFSSVQVFGLGSKDSVSPHTRRTEDSGKPPLNICFGDEPARHIQPSFDKYEVESEYERRLYISAVLDFGSTFRAFIGTSVLKRYRRCSKFPLSGQLYS
ncbi:hypothetical protein POM88_039964 [Heracleum sosnowskyi]|uniref:Uncharacterized protein n=1 Tax=Heracleum sosnowskyi TaxID=360622 RepID=A0AAD8HD74_9APIA|nr:hypothetical protein POM88_039964 [Heracleum sosnowskyi]